MGPGFAFGARWALAQYHPWDSRDRFIGMSDEDVKRYFRQWRRSPECPWHVREQYLTENGRRARGGAGPAPKEAKAQESTFPLPVAEYAARLAACVSDGDYRGATDLQQQQRLALAECSTEYQDSGEGEEGEEAEVQSSEQEQDKESVQSTRLLKLPASGNMEERAREGLLSSKAKTFHMAKHGYNRKTRVDSVAQEMQSALPGGVLNVHEDTDEDDDAFDEMEIERERGELRVAED